MRISMIAAMTQNRVIGRNNDLPWHLPDDLKFFEETTANHHVIMGRRNYESLPPRFRPLPNRTNIVISRQKDYRVEKDVMLVGSLEDALDIALGNGESEAFIIGGAEIFKLGLSHASTIYLTEINAEMKGDVHFPAFDKRKWLEAGRTHHPADDKHEFSFDFVTYKTPPLPR